jgi:uncharacterized membrane protein
LRIQADWVIFRDQEMPFQQYFCDGRTSTVKNSTLCRAAIALGLFTAVPALAQEYNVVDLGTLPSSNSNINPGGSTGVGINNAGQATGTASIGVNTNSVTHSFFWNGSTLSDIDSPSSTSTIIASAINAGGTIAGTTESGTAFTWTSGGGFSPLATPGGKVDASAFGINAAGDVVGQATDESGEIVAGVVWRSGGANTLLIPANSLFFSTAKGINSSRTIVGNSFSDPTTQIATVWTYNSGTDSWTAQSIGALGGGTSSAAAINNAGDIVGQSPRGSGHGIGAVLWHPGDTSPTDLDPTDSLGNTFAEGINSSNDVVGDIGSHGAFIWDSADGIVNLQTLLDPSSIYTITGAMGINDNGDIIATATGSADGLPHAVILEPVPEPSAAALALVGFSLLLMTARRCAALG